MKRATFFLSAAVLFGVYAPVLAQTPDTTSAWRYFPLEVGNVLEYEGLGLLNYSQDYRLSVEAATVIGGQQYFVVAHDALNCSPCIDEFIVRFDAESGHVVERTASGEEVIWWYAPCPFDAPFGSETECGEAAGGYEEAFEMSEGTLLEGVTYKVFDSGSDLKGYVAGIGPVTQAILVFEPGEERLRYARIGGVEYGTQFPVSNEDVAAPESSVALAVYPNPAYDATTISVTLDEPQRVTLAVYDVLGRRVLSENLGGLPAAVQTHRLDLAALPPGIYLVQITGGAGTQATTRFVRQ